MRRDYLGFTFEKVDLFLLDQSGNAVSQSVEDLVLALADPCAVSVQSFDFNTDCSSVSGVPKNA